MVIRKGQLPIVIANLCMLAGFGFYFISKANHEFVLYIGVIFVLMVIIALANRKVYFPNPVLWGLTLWALMHLCGGAVVVKNDVLYELILVPLSQKYPIFRYDQFVHIIGFGVATFVMYYILRPMLKEPFNRPISLSIIIIMAGLGVGALNEIVEAIAVALVPQTGVGGYLNTSLDLIANLIGAITAAVMIQWTHRKTQIER